MSDFRNACYAEARDRGYDDAQATEIAERAERYENDEAPERGPWKKRSPDHPVEAAAERLKGLEERACDHTDEEIADVVSGIAEHFDTDTFKEIARRFGLDKGLSTKGQVVRLIVDRICCAREKDDAVSE